MSNKIKKQPISLRLEPELLKRIEHAIPALDVTNRTELIELACEYLLNSYKSKIYYYY